MVGSQSTLRSSSYGVLSGVYGLSSESISKSNSRLISCACLSLSEGDTKISGEIDVKLQKYNYVQDMIN